MSMDVGGSKGGLKADINVTPLVDVMLVLLIIMMLIAPMLQKGVDVQVAAGRQHARTSRKRRTRPSWRSTSDKQLYLNGVPIQRGRTADARSQTLMETEEGEDRPHQGRRGRSLLGHHGRRWIGCAKPTSRTSASSPNARSAGPGWEASDGTRTSTSARKTNVKARGARTPART
ncbi:MAG: biopolymer transporter ExbD [Candidatus Moduliflexus flocculans]|nr:biopolymer transporter ExbD [Candidatus Moduliflexus flocculans]